MSRSEPVNRSINPATRFFEWAGGSDGGFLRYYDKESKQKVDVPVPFTFLVLDELSVIKGWNDASESGITSNEVRNITRDELRVRAFKGGNIATGLYSDIKNRAKAAGGHFQVSIYIAFKGENGELEIGNIGLKGSGFRKWIDFRSEVGNSAVYDQAVVVNGYEDDKKGATRFRTPVFVLKECSDATKTEAEELDKQLQTYLKEYLQTPLSERGEHHTEEDADDTTAQQVANQNVEDDDIPF